MSNALSRLLSINASRDFVSINTFDIDSYHEAIEDISMNNHAFQKTLMIMTSEFKTKLITTYFEDKSWSKIMRLLKELRKRTLIERNDNDESIKTRIDFELHNELIYHKENRWLCIFASVEKEIFNLTHDRNQYSNATRCFHRIRESIFILRLSRKLKTYIDHCFQCQLSQTKRHKFYEKLMSIIFSSILFHTVAMNFIMTISDNVDTLLTIICKFSKRITIISRKSTYFVKN